MSNLLMIDLLGTTVSALEKELLQHTEVGAVVLFSKNFENKDQLKRLTHAILNIREDLFIAVDQEGGAIQRFQRHQFLTAPAVKTYGDVYDLSPDAGIALAKQYAEHISRDLLECGVDLNFAPVLDLHDEHSTIIGQLQRAFHADPEVLSILAESFIDGMHRQGMPSVGKHFPGHGRCVADSHLSTTVNNDTKEQLWALDLKPFIELIAKNKLDAVMAAHVIYPAVDPDFAAGFSSIWLQDILRKQLGYHGLVISDCLSMKGADIGDLATRAKHAVAAGCDMLILCNEPREALLSFLNQHDFAHSVASQQRIEQFKQLMKRFKVLAFS